MLDPNDFIITRKRKKYKFAKFANSPLCFEFDEWPKSQADVIEIGAGTGLFSVDLASKNQNQTYAAIDVKGDRLQKGAYRAEESGLCNVKFARARADQLDQMFTPASASAIWLTFSDPFLKRRSAGRRLTHLNFLKKYQQILKPGGALYIKHDNREFFNWTLEQLVQAGWRIEELSFDLHESELDASYKIMTTYEARWVGEGAKINFVKASRL